MGGLQISGVDLPKSRSLESDVELTVGKYQGRQVDRDILEGLPLGFVDLRNVVRSTTCALLWYSILPSFLWVAVSEER